MILREGGMVLRDTGMVWKGLGMSTRVSEGALNPYSTGTHFYLQFWVQLDFIDIRKALWRSQD